MSINFVFFDYLFFGYIINLQLDLKFQKAGIKMLKETLVKNGKKKCGRCKKIKFLTDFPKDRCTYDGYSCHCKKCRHNWKMEHKDYYRQYRENNKATILPKQKDCDLRKKFGITLEQFNQILEEQNGVCAICGKKETRVCRGTKCRLSVDHNHETGKIRELLCSNCNVMLAKCNENIEWLDKIKNYIIKHSQ